MGHEPISYARRVYRQGFAVFPLREGSKVPRLRPGHDYLYRRATPEELKRMDWSGRPNYAIPTGKINGICVLDLDADKGGVEAAERLFGLTPRSVLTPVVKTPGGGYHFYFRYDRRAKTSADRIARGIDVRSDGGYVVGPGSVIDGVGVYEFFDPEVSFLNEDYPLQDPPEWMLGMEEDDFELPESLSEPISEGRRNMLLTSLAGTLIRRELPKGVVRDTLLSVNKLHVEPPLSREEVMSIWEGCERRYRKGTSWDRFATG